MLAATAGRPGPSEATAVRDENRKGAGCKTAGSLYFYPFWEDFSLTYCSIWKG